MRRIGWLGLGIVVLGCGGVGDLVEQVESGVEEVVANEVEKGVAKGLGVPQDEVDIHKEGDLWIVDVPHGEGECALGADADGDGLPVKMDDLLARCDVTVDAQELLGKDVPAGVGRRFDIAARTPKGSIDAQVDERRKELEADGLEVSEITHEGFTVLVGLDGKKPVVVAAIGDGGGGPVEFVAVPKDAGGGGGAREGRGGGGGGDKGRKGKSKGGKGSKGR